ncbi:Cytochrome P450 82A3 [Spatholobus suberectus]|nr:Cytochrome P450 82A3 [Spatholobus suberectus]
MLPTPEASVLFSSLGAAALAANNYKTEQPSLKKELILGGTDTTAVTLTWAICLLLRNPLVLAKAKEEINMQIGKDRYISELDTNKLVYLQAIVKETLRLYPPAPLSSPREFTENCILGSYHIKKGTRLIPNLWKIHRDPSVWSDPLEFKPERFLTTHKDVDVRGHHFELLPFGSGRRICAGMSLGLHMVHFTLANFLHSFDILDPAAEPIDMTEIFGFTNTKAIPLEILVKPRIDTSSATLTWAICLILGNPLVLEKVKAELDIQVGKERYINESDISNLIYLQAIVKETLRLYPTAPLSAPREFIEDCTLGSYNVKKGTRLITNLWKIHTDFKVWPDPLEFKPERFLTTHKDIDIRGHHFELLTFGNGRRFFHFHLTLSKGVNVTTDTNCRGVFVLFSSHVALALGSYLAGQVSLVTKELILGGTDSTAVTLTWAICLLLRSPLVLEKAKEEIGTQIGKDGYISESDISKLVYLQAIVKETLRLYPPAPLSSPREFTENCILGGYHVKKETRFIPNLWKIHRDPSVWSDPLEFKPERFLTTHKDVDVRGHHFELLPFGSGRRICAGMSLGLRMVHFTLANLLHSFDILNPSAEPIDMTEIFGFTNTKATPLEILVKPRLSPSFYETF